MSLCKMLFPSKLAEGERYRVEKLNLPVRTAICVAHVLRVKLAHHPERGFSQGREKRLVSIIIMWSHSMRMCILGLSFFLSLSVSLFTLFSS